MDRRQFLQQSSIAAAGTAAGTTILTNPASVKASPANDKINLAIVGCRGRGNNLMQDFLKRGDCEVGYICDVQSNLFESRAAIAEELQGRKPTCVQDFRHALDDSSVDAVIVATPDHWHAPATVWSCQAGKDVYVEKPASHSCWEGRKMVEAARKYERVVQVGTQCRSASYCMEAKKFLEDGQLGRIHLCRVVNMKMWANPQWAEPSAAPESLDWDMWLGPADMRDYNTTYVTSGWHHMWDFSGGDLANDGVHQVDLARWLVGVELPNKVHCSGSRFDSTGAADSPDTQIATLEFDDMLMTFEVTQYTPYMLKTDPVVRNTDMYPYWLQNATRIEIYGTDGMMIVGRHGGGWQTFIRPSNRQPVVRGESYGRFPDPEHKENFFQCIRNRELPNADIEKGHRSALLVHYSNISMRVGGRDLTIDPATEAFVDDAEANALFKRSYRAPWEIKEEV